MAEIDSSISLRSSSSTDASKMPVIATDRVQSSILITPYVSSALNTHIRAKTSSSRRINSQTGPYKRDKKTV